MPFKYLLALERELHIFLALTGGQINRMILRSAVRKYGNPESNIYLFAAENQQYMNALLQHLKLLIRALGRLMEKKDISLLNDLISREDGFRRLGSDPRYDGMVGQVIKWVDRFRKEIISKYE